MLIDTCGRAARINGDTCGRPAFVQNYDRAMKEKLPT